ncbi:DUF2235 domain-containing protein [Paralcaligenes sp. KSB-10]|uniref:phospholipase effector Tle1 domain-containing protein n=1 Tax=Paralcaligenes sp. KSB-10 TaxID=2901142 RepID=UPI001E539410|nr:DUF2235 domain-containing protein [Paralcaligenes sp. KSB-10]UHL63396.1 DUF2235 domain-containing protein [Paralcaligenes sp. KSB-10]
MARHSRAFLFLLALSAGIPAWAQTTCGPSALGEPCAQGGIATLPGNNEPGLNLGVGNPIHLVTGNKYQQEIDLPASRHAPELELRRHYNSLDRRDSALGPGWALSYDTRLFHAGGRWQIIQADGSRITFTHTGPERTRHGTLQAQAQQWIWTWPNGQQNHFDRHGRLIRILFTKGRTLDIERRNTAGPEFGTISRLTAGHGPSLDFAYQILNNRAYLSRIDTHAGSFHYHYEAIPAQTDGARPSGPWRLQRVTRPDGMQRRYLYEPALQAGHPFHLTGIELVSADGQHRQRIRTWAYNAGGRAILSIRGGPQDTQDKLRIRYLSQAGTHSEGITEITNTAGQRTLFHTALKGGRQVLLKVTGAPCAGCAAPESQARYDPQGRLAQINDMTITRSASGAIERIGNPSSGWPGLVLHYQQPGHRTSWSTPLTGTELTQFDARRRPAKKVFANGDRWEYDYDSAGRPVQIRQKNAETTQKTRLGWSGPLLARINHPHENEYRGYDSKGRLTQRRIERPSPAWGPRVRYTEAFDYDGEHRLTRHHLPEGGALHYRWDKHGRLQAIDWQDSRQQMHSVIAGTAQQPGYQYGNGLQLQGLLSGRHVTDLVLHRGTELIWAQHQSYDRYGRLQQERHNAPSENHAETWHYAYDAGSRLAGARKLANPAVWYAWHADGSLAAHGRPQHTLKHSIQRDASGLPKTYQDYALHYGPNRRLTAVSRRGKRLDTYRHNAFGQRIAKISTGSRTDYFYWNNQLVAEARHRQRAGTPSGAEGSHISRRYIYAGHALVGFIDYSAEPGTAGDVPSASLYAVHSDLLGAPRVVTDAQQKIRWLATYSPTGAATRVAGDLTLDLRLPGQIADQSTGWHDNLLRAYLPGLGQYLEPDPLGPIPVNQALGYANQRPKRYTDPLGLLLFAFDGTRNSPVSQTNVWKMSQWYQDGPVFYHSGPGNPNYLDWDAITAYNAPRIIDAQWQALLDELARPSLLRETIPIDILGFSRGAALARHFGNQINQYVENGLFSYTDSARGLISACVDLRFMGLFDTVAQFGLAGMHNTSYDLSIAAAWEWVAHAVALQERRWLFPLTTAADSLGNNTIEAPFVGAHADIGGGLAIDDEGRPNSRGDLSDVALNWMLWQARAASLRFDTAPLADREITEPILHDQRSALARSAQNGDRAVDAADGSTQLTYQDDHPQLGRARREVTEQLIRRIQDWRRSDTTEVGSVDMDGYAQWLQNELGWQALPV